MAIIREVADDSGRAGEDRRRHRQLVEESIKKNLGKIIAEERIIGQSGRKKVKIPIRGLKEYQFIYGRNQAGVGTGKGTEKRGDVVQNQGGGVNRGIGPGAGNEPGEDIYETEITLEELAHYLFDDLKLPDLERKKLAEIETVIASQRFLGYQRKGPPPRLAKQKAVIQKIKRRQALKREGLPVLPDSPELGEETKQRFPFHEEDLRYRRLREIRQRESNAVVICVMDTSGSMDQTKKYLARSFYFLLYQFIRLKYVQVDVVFIAHTTEAKEVNEVEFFHKAESGGTYISSGYQKALDVIETRYPPSKWNVYTFHCSDGDNWDEDNARAVTLARQLCKVCNLFGYGEIMTGSGTVRNLYAREISEPNFAIVTIQSRDDVWPALQGLLKREEGE